MLKSYIRVLRQEDARKKVKEGIELAYDLVAPTLGARPRRILIDKEFGDINSSDDGTTILNDIKLEDPQEELGVKVAREASAKTNLDEGDGTTSTTVILHMLISQLLQENSEKDMLINKGSGNNLKLGKEIRVGLKKVLDYTDKHKINITSKEQMSNIGRVSANNEEIGDITSEIFERLGKDGAISVDEGNSIETTHEITEGMSFDSGWLAPQFVTDTSKEEAVLKPGNNGFVNILITSDRINNVEHMQKIADLVSKDNVNDLLIIADDVSGIPLNSLVVNKLHQVLRVVAVKSPQVGNQKDLLIDICAVTGAKLIGGDDGVKFSEIIPEDLGKAQRVVVSKDKTIIVGIGKYDKEIKERVETLTNRLKNENSEYESGKLEERISKIMGGVGNIKVGGSTPLEIKNKKAKIIDAISAIRSALRGGVVPGGGVHLLRATSVLGNSGGEKILKKAIEKPFELIVENADLDSKELKAKVLSTGHGIDVETEKLGDMIEMGIIDPANVIKSALRNAVSAALEVSNLGGALVTVRGDEENNDVNIS